MLCVDDVGLHDGVNAAAIALLEAGRATALSAMVGAPAWPSAAARLAEVDTHRADIGLHLDFTAYPRCAGLRQPLWAWLLTTHAGLADRASIRSEIEAQLDAFELGLGRGPDFVDGHQHVHQLPRVRDELIAVLQARYGAGQRPWLRNSRPRRRGVSVKAWVLDRLGGRALEALARERGFRQNRRLLGVSDFSADPARLQAQVSRWLRDASDSDLLMCHPSARGLAAARPDDPLHATRCMEFDFWRSNRAGALLDQARVHLCRLPA